MLILLNFTWPACIVDVSWFAISYSQPSSLCQWLGTFINVDHKCFDTRWLREVTFSFSAVLKTFSRACRRVTELSRSLEPLYQKYREPVLRGAATTPDDQGKRQRYSMLQPHIRPALSQTLIINVSTGLFHCLCLVLHLTVTCVCAFKFQGSLQADFAFFFFITTVLYEWALRIGIVQS